MKIAIVLALAVVLSACGTMRHRHMIEADGGNVVFVCHKGKKTLELPRSAVDAHLAHGDWLGRC